MRKLPVNNTGYLKGTKTAKNPVNVIPSNLITTQGMAFPIKANGKTLYPNTGQYKFPTSPVIETPLKQKGVKGLKALYRGLKTVGNYIGDVYNVSKEKGKLTFPRYENVYRWNADEIPDNLKLDNPTKEQLALTGKWFTRKLEDIPYYKVTRPSPGDLLIHRGLKSKFDKLEKNMPAEAKSLSKHPNEVILSDKDLKKTKKVRFDENLAEKAIKEPQMSKVLNHRYYTGELKRETISKHIFPELEKKVSSYNKPILGINREFFPFKKGTKNMKPLIKYKDGSKSVSLAFSRGEKDPKGGLTQKGVDKYNRATGGNLKMAVTTPPSKLKPGSKAANRRKSFCARMSGVKGPMMKNGKPTRKALALRKWNC